MAGRMAMLKGTATTTAIMPLARETTPFSPIDTKTPAWVCGILYQKWKGKGKVILFSALAGTAGALTYVILYLAKNFFESYIFLQLPLAGVLVCIEI